MNQKKTKTFINNSLDFIVSSAIEPLLSKYGFKKNKLCWNKQTDHFIHVIEFQISRYNTEDEGRFTLNFGVFHPQVFTVIWDKNPPKHIAIENCLINERVGFIDAIKQGSEEVYDAWWTINANVNMEVIQKEIEVVLKGKVLPWLTDLTDARKLLSYIKKTTNYSNEMPLCRLNFAVLSFILGTELDPLLKEIRKVGFNCKDWKLRCEIAEKNLAMLSKGSIPQSKCCRPN